MREPTEARCRTAGALRLARWFKAMGGDNYPLHGDPSPAARWPDPPRQFRQSGCRADRRLRLHGPARRADLQRL